ncbi:MAG TPA: ABC transporter ATP-binding protein [bacterium]
MNGQAGVPRQQLIELRGIGKEFPTAGGTVQVLRDVDLSVERGEYVAIVGKSGSGKSTLLNMITGIDHPSQGTVTIDSVAVHTLSESRLARWRGENIGIVFQFFQLIPTLTILENLLLAMDFVSKVPKPDRRARAKALLAQVGLAGHAGKLPTALSGGEQQRAALARALANDPPVLIADEPTGNLDSRTALAVQSLFRELVQGGKTVIVVTHDLNTDAGYERTISLADGAVVGDTRATQVSQERRPPEPPVLLRIAAAASSAFDGVLS